MRIRIIYSLLILGLFVLRLHAQEQDPQKSKCIEFHGFLKNLGSVNIANNNQSSAFSNLIHNRLNFKMNAGGKWSGKLEIRNRLIWGNQLKQIPDYGKYINAYDGYFNLSKLWIDQAPIIFHSVIDRLLIQYSLRDWDIKLGRQRINWGINTIWNPNDLFNAYNFLDFDYEERPGNDALRIQKTLNESSTLEIAYKPGKHSSQHILASLYKLNKWQYDIQLLAALDKSDLVVGGGCAGNLLNAGLKSEISYFHPKENLVDTSGVWSISLMLDQTFDANWYLSIASLFNSKPLNLDSSNTNLFNTQLTAKNLLPFKYSFYTSISKSFIPILRSNLSIVYATRQNTLLLLPSLTWNVLNNLDLDFNVQIGFSQLNQSYHSIGNALYIRGKWSY